MKLIIQIPSLNEQDTLPATPSNLPRRVAGFDCVEFMVIDDGSTDSTAEVARLHGVEHIVRLRGHEGLARAFLTGLLAGVERGADVIVNTDADNQYDARDIERLVKPILEGSADMVVGARPLWSIGHFSLGKRLCQVLGSRVISFLSLVRVADATSGFRAISWAAAVRLNVFDHFTYTIETILQAGLNDIRCVSVPVRVNGPTRRSRLFRSSIYYIWRSMATMITVFFIYRATRVFRFLAMVCACGAIVPGLLHGYDVMRGEGSAHFQTLVISGSLLGGSAFWASAAVLTHLLSINRRLLEELRSLLLSKKARKRRYAKNLHRGIGQGSENLHAQASV